MKDQKIPTPEDQKRMFWNAMSVITVWLLFFAICLLLGFCSTGCRSVQQVVEYQYRDSVIVHHDTTHTYVVDTNYVEQHVIVTDTSHIVIQFGEGGGTYNAQTGQATNVSGVQQSTFHNEQRDSMAFYKHEVETLTASNDSLSQSIGNYKSELKKEQAVPKRSGWDRFCMWWVIISWILIILAVAWWCFKKFYLRR